ncbi:MAG TPA: ABC transporter permease [Vicinamibacterales bacterium]|nr:ABC transporter permease [Vicinamibacterales bacterium]
MSLLMIFVIALRALARNKLRTALTMLGMIIGVAAVITMVALGSGAQAAIEEQIRGAGTNMITIFPGSVNMGGVKQGQGTSSRLIPDDAKALRALPEVQYVSEGLQTRQQVIYSNQNWQTNIVGVNTDYVDIKSWPTKYGAFFTDDDVRSAAKVCLLGINVSENLFGEDVDPTGIEIRIRNQIFHVLGVMSPKGASSSGQNQDDQILAPYTTVMKKLQGTEFLNYILVGARSADQVEATSEAVSAELRVLHKIQPGDDDDFRVQTQDDMIAMRTQATQTMTSLLAGIAGVSLVVGGIGIMNIMLVSVTERTREIGLRMAIGARGFDVLLQFLVEAVVISVVGGSAGILIGYGLAEFMKRYQNMTTLVPPDAVVIAVGFSAAVGIFFGFYPARKAASLDPIEALRFE